MPKWVQNPTTGKLVPAEEVDWDRYSTLPSQHIMDDIEPFISPVDGTVVTSRSRLREHNARNGVVNYHEFDGEWEKVAAKRQAVAEGRDPEAKKDRLNDIIRSVEKVEAGHKPEIGEYGDEPHERLEP